MVEIRLAGASFDCEERETVLDALLRHGIESAYSCRAGTCLTCMLRAVRGEVPAAAQEGLRETLRAQGYFLPCICRPGADLEIARADEAALFGRVSVVARERLAPRICRVTLDSATGLDYRAGQFVNLRRFDGLTRSYSLASVPGLDRLLEVHVKWWPGGAMSDWIFDGLRPGDVLGIQGPNGASFYLTGRPDQPLLLVGNGTGLAPLIGIARDALHAGHKGEVRLYHGSRHAAGLYLQDELQFLAARHANFRYIPCVSGDEAAAGCRPGRAEAAAFADQADLSGWRVFLCGHPAMAHAARRRAYLAGASLADIHGDPFELKDVPGASAN